MSSTPALCIQVDEEMQLRLLEERHVEEYHALIERNRQHLQEWMDWASAASSVEEDKGAYIKYKLQQFANNQGFQMGIWYQGRLVGSAAFNNLNWSNCTVEIGYWLAADAQGKGLVTKACRTLIAYAFEEYRLNKVEIHCAVGNTRSRAVAERLGFTQEGIIRQHEPLHGQYVDTVIYGLLVSEWKPLS